jgi:hypothetical protein
MTWGEITIFLIRITKFSDVARRFFYIKRGNHKELVKMFLILRFFFDN